MNGELVVSVLPGAWWALGAACWYALAAAAVRYKAPKSADIGQRLFVWAFSPVLFPITFVLGFLYWCLVRPEHRK